jgi:hypothetical protein
MNARLLAGAALTALTIGAAVTAGAVSAQGLSGDMVKIGVLNDRSGLYTDLGGEGSAVAARMAAEEFGNKILGKPIQIITADHQNKPDIGSNIARQWIDQDGVDVIVDVPNSGVALAVQEITREKKKIFLMEGPATSRLSGDACSPTGFHWAYDTHALAVGTGRALVQEGGNSWYFLTADYAFGHQLEADTAAEVKKAGGQVLGAVRHPLNTSDFSSFLLQAQSSGAKIVALANAGGDTITSIKQASEFGLTQSGNQKLAGLLLFLRRQRAGAFGGAGSGADHWILLGHGRREARLVEEVFREIRQDADHGAGGQLFRRSPLSEGHRSGGHRRWPHGRRQDERDAGQRHVRQERQDPAQRPHGPRHVSGACEKAVRIEGTVGLLPGSAHHSRFGSLRDR